MENIVADLGLSGVGALEADENLNISDVIDVIRSTDPEFSAQSMYSGGGPVEQGARAAPSSITQIKKKAFVQITEQPASKALRFRYECEGRSAGSIPGVNSTPENKTFPSIQVVGYRGRAIIVVSCVTKDLPYRPHPHNLVGKEGCKKGICTVEINSDSMSCTFSNLGIQCVKKKDIEEALKQRETIRVDPYRTGFAHRSQPSGIDLNAVRLCFQVFLEGDDVGKFSFPLKPVVSDPIYDKKAMSDLVICKLSHCSCSVAGGQEIILLCEKVAKEDISVRFYEEQSGHLVWEGFGDFQHTNVHKQTAICFRAPRYRTLEVDRPVKVFIQLRRPSDGATSEPLPFELLQLDSGRAPFWSIGTRSLTRRTPLQFTTFQRILAADPALVRQRVEPEAEPAAAEPPKSNGVEKPIEEVEPQNHHGNGISTIDKIMSEDKEDEVIVLSPDESPEEIIGEQPQEVIVDGDSGILDNGPCKSQTDRSLDDLLEQVAELDEIYTDAQTRQQNFSDNVSSNETNNVGVSDTNDESMDVDFDDNATYTSLQLAFKNPIDLLDEPISKTLEISNYDDVDITTPPAPLIQIKSDNRSRGSTPKPAGQTVETDVGWMIPPPIPPHPVVNGKRDITEEKLPPLPPKRIKKTLETPEPQRTRAMTIGSKVEEKNNVNASRNSLGSRPQSQIIIISAKEEESSDNIQNQTLPRPKKQGFLQKLFSKKPKKDKTPRSSVSRESSVNNINVVTGSIPSVRSTTESAPGNLTIKSSKRNKAGKPVGRSVSSVSGKRPAFKDGPDVIHIPLKGDSGSCVSLNQGVGGGGGGGSLGGSLAAGEFGSMGLVKLDAGSIKQLYGENVLNDLEQNLDLTDAEHYALYTDVAPHATASEFDEASCYYAPVEGGQIIALTTDSNIQAINLKD